MTVASTAPADLTTTPDRRPVEFAECTDSGGGAPVILVWAGVACTIVWIAALGFTAYLGVAAALHRLFG